MTKHKSGAPLPIRVFVLYLQRYLGLLADPSSPVRIRHCGISSGASQPECRYHIT